MNECRIRKYNAKCIDTKPKSNKNFYVMQY